MYIIIRVENELDLLPADDDATIPADIEWYVVPLIGNTADLSEFWSMHKSADKAQRTCDLLNQEDAAIHERLDKLSTEAACGKSDSKSAVERLRGHTPRD